MAGADSDINAPAIETTAITIPPLLQIPLEIRQTIWKYCQPKKSDLTVNCCLSASTPHDSPEDKLFRLRYDDLETVVPKNPHPLLYINCQISRETLALWKGGWIFWLCGLTCARELIERMSKRQMSLVGELHMYRPSYGNQGQYEWLVLESEAMTEAWRKSPDNGSDMVLVKADGIRWQQLMRSPYRDAIVPGLRVMYYSHRSIYQKINVGDGWNIPSEREAGYEWEEQDAMNGEVCSERSITSLAG